jgi:hypothetical protein
MAKFPNEIKVKADGELLQLLEQISKKLDEQDQAIKEITELLTFLVGTHPNLIYDGTYAQINPEYQKLKDAFQRLRARWG